MVQLGNRVGNSINLQILHFRLRHGMPTPARVQFPAWLLQVQTPGRGGGCRSENYINVRNAYF